MKMKPWVHWNHHSKISSTDKQNLHKEEKTLKKYYDDTILSVFI